MSPPETFDILNELLSLEQGCVILRLDEAGTFVDRLSLRQGRILRHFAAESRENVAQLGMLIVALGGTPAPRVVDVRATELHYWGASYALAHVVENQEDLINAYAEAATQLSGEPEAQRVVAEILARHQARLATIKDLLPPDVRAVS
ncbi:MAG: ferritin-like domain-containing protein [Phycisphaerae bacterium]|nr:ferritin-like domain-containing protein [Phycisphaerae bacterium]